MIGGLLALRIKQYACYAIYSRRLSPAEISQRVGLQPDQMTARNQTSKRGSRFNVWKLVSAASGLDVDLGVQIQTLVQRMRPYQQQLVELAEDIRDHEGDNSGCGHTFMIIRHFDHDDGELDGWQHHLLGWALEPETLRFLADLGVGFGADEYGQEFSWWQWRQRRRYYAPIEVGESQVIDTGWSIRGKTLKPME